MTAADHLPRPLARLDLRMSDVGTYNTARACNGRVRVPALGACCDQQPVMWSRERGMAICGRTATGPMPTVFRHAVRVFGTHPTATIKRHHLRPSECLM